ncbi:MAG: cupin domain-containing protein [Acidobacteria bacterium]|nr:cupin domain-containing protein [Acidobacteriota bacterium]
MLTAQEIIKLLELEPLVPEGGFYRRTYCSSQTLTPNFLSAVYQGSRPLSTAIYYFLTPETFSTMHKLASDEIFHFYLGDMVEILQLYPDSSGQVIKIGNDLLSGAYPQVLAPAGCWQGLRLISGGRYALLGTTMSPGFDDKDYLQGNREDLISKYPDYKDLIIKLT